VRVAVVGGASTYTPELADGFARLRDQLPVEELVLIDPAAERLQLVGGLTSRIFARYGHPARVTLTTDLDAGVTDAAIVLLQLRVGGQAARHGDESWPLECGCVGQETTGAGGLAKAMRTVPVVLDIAARVARRSPHAWLVDFTNPVGIVTRALLREGHRAIGLCNVAIGFQRRVAELLGVRPDALSLDHVGLNHLTWERAVFVDGRDVLPGLLADHAHELAAGSGLPARLLRELGVVPSYYLRYYYAHDAVVRELQEEPPRAARVAAIEQELLELYADPSLDQKPELLSSRGGAYYSEAAVELCASLVGDSGNDGTQAVRVVNTFNRGALPFLADDAVVEVPARVGRDGPEPAPIDPVDPLFAGLISAVSAYEDLALSAALQGGRERVFRALLAHPLVGQVELADGLTDRLLAHNREYLPWA